MFITRGLFIVPSLSVSSNGNRRISQKIISLKVYQISSGGRIFPHGSDEGFCKASRVNVKDG